MTCSSCSAFLFTVVGLSTGLCHGCRSLPPEQRVEAPPTQHRALVMALASRVHAAHEVLARLAEKRVVRPWWEQANEVEGGCPW